MIAREWVPPFPDGDNGWRNGYWRCAADEAAEQRQCSLYRPCSEAERLKQCHPAESGSCKFCECGCSDLCAAQEISQ
jgi:hypothetical protein